jgi:hypothetical protein
MFRSRWSTALGRGTYGGFVVGQDGQRLLSTLHRQVRRLLARLIQTLMAARTHATPHRYTAFTARRRDTLECTCCSEGGTVGACAGNKPVSSPRIGSWLLLYATVFASIVVHEARGHEGTLCTLLPLAAPSGLCCTDVPSSPTGRPNQLAACTGACAPGWMYTVPQGAQLSAAMVWFGWNVRRVRAAPGLHQHRHLRCLPSDEDSPTTVQLLPTRPSAHAPQLDGVERLAWRAT